jgi:hypothetical protein
MPLIAEIIEMHTGGMNISTFRIHFRGYTPKSMKQEEWVETEGRKGGKEGNEGSEWEQITKFWIC